MLQRNHLLPILIGILVSSLFITGCGPSVDLTMNFDPDTVSTYELAQTMTKDFKFEQPALKKKRQEETSTTLAFVFDQKIKSIDEQGWAVAQITIKQMKCKMIKVNQVQIDFDSTQDKAASNPLNKLIGQSYSIRLGPNGRAELLDASGVKVNNISGLEGTIAKSLFKPKEVQKRHQVLALPPDAESLSVGKTWSQAADSPPELLSPKSYEKNYTLNAIENRDGTQVAKIAMVATDKPPAPGTQSSRGMGIFANLLDNEDEYTGSMELNLQSGVILEYQEKLVSTYIAQQPNSAAPEEAPDTLQIRFIQSIERKQVD